MTSVDSKYERSPVTNLITNYSIEKAKYPSRTGRTNLFSERKTKYHLLPKGFFCTRIQFRMLKSTSFR